VGKSVSSKDATWIPNLDLKQGAFVMRGKIVFAGLVLAMAAAVTRAQNQPAVPTPNELYCSGTVTTQAVPRDTYVITGEESEHKITFDEGDVVYINTGSEKGAKPGDEFSVIRPIKDPTYEMQWTKWQNSILHKMGTVWEDEGRVKVLIARPKVSIAQVEHFCNYVQRGDVVIPFVERPTPPLKSEKDFDRYAPADGKPMAMVITGKGFMMGVGSNDIVYVNLGNAQGVKVGDYFRIFRYHGTQHEMVFQTPRYSFDQEYGMGVPSANIMGFGSVPSKWTWSNVPREDLGEGIVLRTGPNSSTVLITLSLRAIYAGDYVEVE
jgi:hypothetical protein